LTYEFHFHILSEVSIGHFARFIIPVKLYDQSEQLIDLYKFFKKSIANQNRYYIRPTPCI